MHTSPLNDILLALSLIGSRLRRMFGWLALVACIAAVFEAVGVFVAFGLIRLILEPEVMKTLPIIESVTGFLGVENINTLFVFAAITMGILFLFKNMFLAYATYLQQNFTNSSATAISHGLMRRYLLAPYENIYSRNSADLIVGVGMVSYAIASRILLSAVLIFTEGLIVLGVAAVLITSEPLIFLATAITFGSLMIGYHLVMRGFYLRWGQEQIRHERAVSKIAYESLHSVKEIKLLRRESYFLKNFLAARKNLVRVVTLTLTANALPRLVSETLIVWAMALVIVLIMSQERPVLAIISTLGLFAFAGFRLMPSVNRLTLAFSTLKNGKPALDRVRNDIRDLPIEDSGLKHNTLGTERLEFSDRLEVRDVSFTYAGSDVPVLRNISFRIPRGQSVGVVGGTGAGKTTLIDIILGLFRIQSGSILLDGVELDTESVAWRKLLGYVPQEISLIDDTLRRNVALGLSDDQISADRIAAAIEMASLDDVVKNLPQGLDTVIGERGARLSGGQCQRIGIARALYNDPEILIMDEATSSLDTETENEIIESVAKVTGNKTVIVIAHRLSTVRRCEQLLFLKDGRLLDSGTFEDVGKRNADFARMVQLAEVSGTTLDEQAI